MIHFVTGKPGGGKSLYGMRLIVDELRLTKRQIVTNLPVNLGELNAYMQERFPDLDCDVLGRVCLLDGDEPKEYFRYRGLDQDGKRIVLDKPDTETGKIEFGKCPAPVLYVIDEIHIFFNAREWAKTGKAAVFYNSQHRKLGDDLVCITQFLGSVDKQFRSVAQDFTTLRNYSNEKLGWFRMPSYFERRTYQEPPGPTAACCEVGRFRLDVTGIGKCYNTGAGVGIIGRADSGNVKTGLNWKWAIPVAIVAIIILAMIPGWISGAAMEMFLGPVKAEAKATNQVQVQEHNIEPKQFLPIKYNPRNEAPKRLEETEKKPQEDEVFIVGHTILGKDKMSERYYLTDGTTIGGWQVVYVQGPWVYLKEGDRFRWEPENVKRKRAGDQGKVVASMGQPPAHNVGIFNP